MNIENRRSPPTNIEVGDTIELLVAPFLVGRLIHIRQGRYELEGMLYHEDHGEVWVGLKNTRVLNRVKKVDRKFEKPLDKVEQV